MRPRAVAMCALIGMADRFFEYRRAHVLGVPSVLFARAHAGGLRGSELIDTRALTHLACLWHAVNHLTVYFCCDLQSQ